MSRLPENVELLLRQTIETFEQLEVVLLLHREQEHRWTVQMIAEHLRLETSSAAEALEQLRRAGLVHHQSTGPTSVYRYAHDKTELREAVEQLARVNRDERLEVIRAMNKNAIERVRTQAIRTFADAFLIGRQKSGSGS